MTRTLSGMTTLKVRENNWSEWYPHGASRGGLGEGHPMTGDVWASEMAGVSWNLMSLLVTFDGDTQAIVQTITGGPVDTVTSPANSGDPYFFARSYEPTAPISPGDALFIGQGAGNCYDSIAVKEAADRINANNRLGIQPCLAEP